MPRATKAKPRRRLDAAAARELILDATEKRLVQAGPSGIRLQEVAADAGVSHPTVLHHFGSRELLVQAVITRALHAINASLIEAISQSQGKEEQLEGILHNLAAALEKSGHGRIMLWLALEGIPIGTTDVSLRDVVDATHALRMSRFPQSSPPARADTARIVVLVALALVGGTALGPTIMTNAGLAPGDRSAKSFHSWLARLVQAHFAG